MQFPITGDDSKQSHDLEPLNAALELTQSWLTSADTTDAATQAANFLEAMTKKITELRDQATGQP